MMKKEKFLTKTGTLSAALLALIVFVLSSCLKDNSPASQNNYSKSPALVGFQYTGGASIPYIAAILGTPQDTIDVEVTLSVPSITLGSTVSCTLVPYQAGLDSFNTANGTTYQALDPSLYTLQNGGQVTISPGQHYVTARINFAGDKIDLDQKWVVCLAITGPQGAIVASNLSTAIVIVQQKSIYEGNYHAFGVRVHPVLGPFPFDYDVYMSTVGKFTIGGPAEADLETNLQITVNPDNSVTLGSTDPYTPILQAGMENDYNPATKTFVLNYYYNTGAPRLINETLVAQ